MKYNLNINQHNIKPHLDIEKDIQKKKNGLFTFNLRVSQGNIEDYSSYDTVTIGNYQGIGVVTVQEQIISYYTRTPGEPNAVRPNNR